MLSFRTTPNPLKAPRGPARDALMKFTQRLPDKLSGGWSFVCHSRNCRSEHRKRTKKTSRFAAFGGRSRFRHFCERANFQKGKHFARFRPRYDSVGVRLRRVPFVVTICRIFLFECVYVAFSGYLLRRCNFTPSGMSHLFFAFPCYLFCVAILEISPPRSFIIRRNRADRVSTLQLI